MNKEQIKRIKAFINAYNSAPTEYEKESMIDELIMFIVNCKRGERK